MKLNSDGIFPPAEFLVEPIQKLLNSCLHPKLDGVLEFLAVGLE